MATKAACALSTHSRVCAATRPYRWLSVVLLLASCYLLYLWVKWAPHSHAWVNWIRCGTYAVVHYAAWTTIMLAFHPGVPGGDDEKVRRTPPARTACVVATCRVVAQVDAALSHAGGASHGPTRLAACAVARRWPCGAPT